MTARTTAHPPIPESNVKSKTALGLLAAALAATALAACGGDDDDSTAPAGSESTENAAQECAATDLTFTNLETGVSGTATTALAKQTESGLYTAYVADFDIDEDDLQWWRPEVPADGNVISVNLTVFNASEPPGPVEADITLEATSEFDVLTFVAAHYSDEDEWSHTDLLVDGPRTMTVTAVGDTFCFEIDFVDQQKEFSGTVAAPVFRP